LKKRKILPAIIGVALLPLCYGQQPKPAAQKKPAPLTKEERDIIKNREILENLELLQNFDKFWYFDLFSEKETKKTESQPKEPVKKEERKVK
jgi:hypothetical protein